MANNNDLNTYLANVAVLIIKMYNLHWNVVGREFKMIHEFTENMYTTLQEQFDSVAEALKMQEKLPMASMAEYLDNADIEELDSRDYCVGEVLEIIDEDLEKMINLALDIRNKASKEDNFMISNMFEEYLSCFYKKSWMIKAMFAQEDVITFEEIDKQ